MKLQSKKCNTYCVFTYLNCCSFFSSFCCRRRLITASGLEMERVKLVSGNSAKKKINSLIQHKIRIFSERYYKPGLFTLTLYRFLVNFLIHDVGKKIVKWRTSSVDEPQCPMQNRFKYSCNNITTTLIQISRLFLFNFFSKTNNQMMI